jgi:plastocyanin
MVRSSVIALLLTTAASPAGATVVRGSVLLPAEPRVVEHDAHWRGPRVPDARTDVIVALDGGPAAKSGAASATVDMHGLRLDPRIAVVPVGGAVEFKNDDRVPHTLYVEHGATLMPPAPTPSGQSRTQKFYAAGEYRVRDEEYPHVDGVVLVLPTAWFARLDDKGNFKLDVPEGKYTLRVFFRDKWVVSQPLEVGAHASEVTVQVPASATANAGATTGAKP